jgi:hydroxymethylpyrimidine/phosphomethylpyrimidine kinase
MIPRILIIAGSDSGGGAGVQADIKTVTMLGGHAMTAITAITAQNTLGVQAVLPVPTEMVLAQINSVVTDIGLDAVKIGMLGSAATAEAVAGVLSVMRKVPIVFDPVMVATSGATLADSDTIAAFDRLMRLATIVTPNLPELAALGGECRVTELAAATLIKGGHASGDQLVDRLVSAGGQREWINQRVDSRHTHGTGCTLASAVATGLGAGLTLESAVDRAIAFVHSAIVAAPELGLGGGPIGHAIGRTPYYDSLAADLDDGSDAATFVARWKPDA